MCVCTQHVAVCFNQDALCSAKGVLIREVYPLIIPRILHV